MFKPTQKQIRRTKELDREQDYLSKQDEEGRQSEIKERRKAYDKVKVTYSEYLSQLSGPDDRDANVSVKSGEKKTFRKQAWRDEMQEKPVIGRNTEKYLKRSQSVGNIQHSLYYESAIRAQKSSEIDRKSAEGRRKASSSSVLKNAGITNDITNSDRYLAIKLTKEF